MVGGALNELCLNGSITKPFDEMRRARVPRHGATTSARAFKVQSLRNGADRARSTIVPVMLSRYVVRPRISRAKPTTSTMVFDAVERSSSSRIMRNRRPSGVTS